jgi:hypothetical protein
MLLHAAAAGKRPPSVSSSSRAPLSSTSCVQGDPSQDSGDWCLIGRDGGTYRPSLARFGRSPDAGLHSAQCCRWPWAYGQST